MPKLADLGPYLAEESEPLSYTRFTGGSYDAGGRWQGGMPTTISFIGVIQPAVGVGSRTQPHLSDLPEGIRREMRHLVWTEVRLDLDDVITWDGRKYRVLFVWDREHDGGYTRAGIGLLHVDSSTEPPAHDMEDQLDDPDSPPYEPPVDPDDPPPYVPPDIPWTPIQPSDPKDPSDPRNRKHPQCGISKSAALRMRKRR